jgi:HPt (histidine-containing phosphotransfer) domain-containing protein
MDRMDSSNMPQPDQFAAALAEIRERFVEGLYPLINEMEYQRVALDDPAQALRALESLQRAAHKISGMAGSVGFAEMGQLAAELDVAFARMRRAAHDSRAVASVLDPLENLLEMMEDALDTTF